MRALRCVPTPHERHHAGRLRGMPRSRAAEAGPQAQRSLACDRVCPTLHDSAQPACVAQPGACRAGAGRVGGGCQGGTAKGRVGSLPCPPRVEQVTRHHAARPASAAASEDHVARPARRTAREPPPREHARARAAGRPPPSSSPAEPAPPLEATGASIRMSCSLTRLGLPPRVGSAVRRGARGAEGPG